MKGLEITSNSVVKIHKITIMPRRPEVPKSAINYISKSSKNHYSMGSQRFNKRKMLIRFEQNINWVTILKNRIEFNDYWWPDYSFGLYKSISFSEKSGIDGRRWNWNLRAIFVILLIEVTFIKRGGKREWDVNYQT